MDAPPQVAFRSLAEPEWRWYRERDITPDRIKEFRRCEFRIYGSPEAHATIVEKLQAAGCEFGEALWTDLTEEQRQGLCRGCRFGMR